MLLVCVQRPILGLSVPLGPAMKTMTSRDFNQDVGSAKRAAADGPVLITDRGKPSHVLISIDDYRALTQSGETLGTRFRAVNEDHPTSFDWEPPRALGHPSKGAKFEL